MICCESGAAALEYLRAAHAPVQLAVLDYQMPAMDGIQLAREIRAMGEAAEHREMMTLPLILMTSAPTLECRARAMMAGVDRVLAKPVKPSLLYTQIASLLMRAKSDEEAVAQPPSHPTSASGGVSAAPVNGTGGASRGRILVVDDDAINLRVAVLILERLGYRSDVAGNGREALDALAVIRYDLVLMDCHMPVLDGYAATEALRRRETETGQRRTKIVALTASAMVDEQARVFAVGMDDYLSKPIQLAQLKSTLERHLTAN